MKGFKIKYFTVEKDYYNEEIIDKIIKKEGKILKDTSRSYVKKVEIGEKKIVFKIPLEKNNSLWIRFLTLFRKSEAIKVLETMNFLNKNDIYTNLPILCCEKRKYGMVVDSFIIFEYLEGDVVKKEDAEEVIKLIKKIHKLGYIHSDTQMKNFINKNGKICTIDAKLKKKLFGKISENLEYINFGVDIEEAYNYVDTSSFNFKISKFIYNFFRLKRRVSKKIKTKFLK